jgi:chromosome condensin MukBEF ATPase and DNA-binding subunit MukB|tara:strand:- start:742 stop:954 length:213 start_codon:yes stop_codon:yes gene_type:complete
MANIDREIGEVSARLTALERDMAELRDDIKWMRDQVQQSKGGWRTIAFLISASGILGAFATLLSQHMWFK